MSTLRGEINSGTEPSTEAKEKRYVESSSTNEQNIAPPVTNEPSISPSSTTTSKPSVSPSLVPVTYRPGLLNNTQHNILLSQGLELTIIAEANKRVQYHDGNYSSTRFHFWPDMGDTFAVPASSTDNPGGWVYVSNSEIDDDGGGVGAITFDKDGNIIDYRMVLTQTSLNCGGGRTPWNTWISCEENGSKGQIYEVDPFGSSSPRKTVLGRDGGNFESFAYDDRNPNTPRFFVSEDKANGALRRFTPDDPNWNDPSDMLHGNGSIDYLVLRPGDSRKQHGTYSWTQSKSLGRKSADKNFEHVEGIDRVENQLFFVSKVQKELFILDLDGNTYTKESTQRGMFQGGPDQMKRMFNDDSGILYFTEDGSNRAGLHARDMNGNYFTILESATNDGIETTGLSFSPDHKSMYFAYQKIGILFCVSRKDGLPFDGRSLNVRYHNSETS